MDTPRHIRGYISLPREVVPEFSALCKEMGLKERLMLKEAVDLYLPTLRGMVKAKRREKSKFSQETGDAEE